MVDLFGGDGGSKVRDATVHIAVRWYWYIDGVVALGSQGYTNYRRRFDSDYTINVSTSCFLTLHQCSMYFIALWQILTVDVVFVVCWQTENRYKNTCFALSVSCYDCFRIFEYSLPSSVCILRDWLFRYYQYFITNSSLKKLSSQ